MLRGTGIARDFVVNELGRTQLVGGTDALYQILYKFFETAFLSLAFQKIDAQYPGSLQQGVRQRTEQFVSDQRASINIELFQGNEIVQSITITSVSQTAPDQFQVVLSVGLADNTVFSLPQNIRVA